MLSVLYAAIATELAAIHAYVVPLIGEEYVRDNEAPPQIIMWPTTDTFGPAEGPGGNPKPLATVVKTTQVVIRGRTRDDVEGMRDQLVIALHAAVKGANHGQARAGRYALGGGQWMRNTLRAVNGFEYRMTFDYAAPIVKRRWAAVTPPQAPDASTYTGDQANTYGKATVETFAVTADVTDAGAKVNFKIGDQGP